jgi:hypothetical protein
VNTVDPAIVAALIGAAAVIVAALIQVTRRSSVPDQPAPMVPPLAGPSEGPGGAATSGTATSAVGVPQPAPSLERPAPPPHSPSTSLIQTPEPRDVYGGQVKSELEASFVTDLHMVIKPGDKVSFGERDDVSDE